MSYVTRLAAHCDVCSHEWLTSIAPSHCARCKSRKWNSGAGPKEASVKSGLHAEPIHPAARRQSLESMVEAFAKPDKPPCGFLAFNDQDGESYRCCLPDHGVKVKHGAWERVG
jgi:hypothetical protein